MKIVVQYTTQLRRALGKAQEQLELPDGTTLQQVLDELSSRHTEAFDQFVLSDNGQLLPNMIVCVEDQQITQPRSFPLHDGATVTLLSAISGG